MLTLKRTSSLNVGTRPANAGDVGIGYSENCIYQVAVLTKGP